MGNPLVSICIPTYNGEAHVAAALKSVLAQTYSNIEIVVSDDASKDNTLQIVRDFQAKTHVPFKIYEHQPNGIGANWNHCIKKANGKYIKFLFQDDLLEPNCIEQMITVAESSHNVGLVYCKRHIIYNSQNRYDTIWIGNFKTLHESWHTISVKQGVHSGKTFLKDEYLLKHPVNKIGEPTAVLLNRSCFDKVGYFNTQLEQALDVEYWYRLMPHFKFGFVDDCLVSFRLHENQASQINAKRKINEDKILARLFFVKLFMHLHRKSKKQVLVEILYLKELKRFFKNKITKN